MATEKNAKNAKDRALLKLKERKSALRSEERLARARPTFNFLTILMF